MEFNQETNEKNETEEKAGESSQGLKQWFQDNLRIIMSIAVVVLIAGGIYSYSNRSVAPQGKESEAESDILSQLQSQDQDNDQASEEAADQEAGKETEPQKAESQPSQPEPAKSAETAKSASQETDGSFIETAGQGDSLTKLARKALADYLEKNPDSALTAEHKIYIEDYLRKNVSHKGHVGIGTSVEFSKSLISDAISKSKNLNDSQLKNLHKYAVRVPSLQ